MPQFENPVAKMEGRPLSIGAIITTDAGVEYELSAIGRSGRRAGAVMITEPATRYTRWIHTDFIPGLTVEEFGL